MSEQSFRSPGFFEQETDRSTATRTVFGVPAGVIGLSEKGPAFVPVNIGSFGNFRTIFGNTNPEMYAPYAVNEFLKHKNALTFIRVLGAGANETEADIVNTSITGTVKNAGFVITGSSAADGSGTVKFISAKHQRHTNEVVGYPLFTDNNTFSDVSGSSLNNLNEEEIVRAMVFLANDTEMHVMPINYPYASASDDSSLSSSKHFNLVFTSTAGSEWSEFDGNPGVKVFKASLDPNDNHYIAKILNTNPFNFSSSKHLLYADFPVESEIAQTVNNITLLSGSLNTSTKSGNTNLSFRDAYGKFDTRYKTPKTTSFISQPFGTKEYNLFHFETISDGSNANNDYKISISNLRASTDPSNPYGTFDVLVREYGDSDKSPRILESFVNCDLNPRSDRYIARLIGDKKTYFDFDQLSESEKRLVSNGRYSNRSERIRIVMDPSVENADIPPSALPFGFRGLPLVKTTDVLTIENGKPLKDMHGRVIGKNEDNRLFTSKKITAPQPTDINYENGVITFENLTLDTIDVIHVTDINLLDPFTVTIYEDPITQDKSITITVDGNNLTAIGQVVDAINNVANTWVTASSGDGLELIEGGNKFDNQTDVLQAAIEEYKKLSAVLPPVPFRFKVTRGEVKTLNPGYVGHPGTNERVDASYYWGISTKRIQTSRENPNSILSPNAGDVDNQLLKNYSKFLGIQKLDMLLAGAEADEYNNNKFTLARVALKEESTTNSLVELNSVVTGSASEHMLHAAYIRNGKPSAGTYTVSDRILQNRFTLASLIHHDPVMFNRFSNFMKFTNIFYGGFDGVNILDRDMSFMKDRSMSAQTGGKGSVLQPPIGLNPMGGENQSGWGRRNNSVASFRSAIDIVTDSIASNINILAMPGVREPVLTDYALEKVREYSMAIYLLDPVKYDENGVRIYDGEKKKPNVRMVQEQFETRGIDNNYAATYFPDVIIDDEFNSRAVKVPASIAALGTLAYNDKISFPWFAPAGFNRASLNFVRNVETRVNAVDRDLLYSSRINPIAKFPQTGFVIFGQKTLQQSKSALDRVNVRRLVLEVKRIISSAAMRLPFENFSEELKDEFLKTVTPQLGTIQMQAGIEQFRVIMDSTNNTIDDENNNRINGSVIMVPTRAVEFISVDFIITNSGVVFEN